MAEEYDPVPDLAELLASAISYRSDVHVYADRISSQLGLGEDDSAGVVAEVLRKALGAEEAARLDGQLATARGAISSLMRPQWKTDADEARWWDEHGLDRPGRLTDSLVIAEIPLRNGTVPGGE